MKHKVDQNFKDIHANIWIRLTYFMIQIKKGRDNRFKGMVEKFERVFLG